MKDFFYDDERYVSDVLQFQIYHPDVHPKNNELTNGTLLYKLSNPFSHIYSDFEEAHKIYK